MDIENIRLEKLRNELIQKIEEEWKVKWLSHGIYFKGFEELPSLNAFLEDLLEDIEQTIKDKIGLKATAEILISKDSLRRFVQNPKLGAIKYKTRHTIAYYLGYDGWYDFEQKIEPLVSDIVAQLPIEQNTPSPSKTVYTLFKKNGARLSGAIILVLIISLVVFFMGKVTSKKDNVLTYEVANKEDIAVFPTAIKISYNIETDNIDDYYIKQHIEPIDWYLKKDTTSYKLEMKNGEKIIYCDKPGLHHIDLMYKNTKVKTLKVPIRTKNWFGITYAKDKNNPKNFIYSSPKDWLQLQEDLVKKVKVLDKRKLSVPTSLWSDKSYNGQYRTDFFYSGDISIDGDSVCIEAEIWSADETESFDCKYFQLGFIDSGGTYLFMYSPISTCSTQGALGTYKDTCDECYPNQITDLLNVDPKKSKHYVKFYFKDKMAFVELDGTFRYKRVYNFDIGKVDVLNFSLNGESALKFLKLSNTVTNQIVYEEYFD